MSPQPRRLMSLKWFRPTAPSLSRSSCMASHPMSFAALQCGLLLLGFLQKTWIFLSRKKTSIKELQPASKSRRKRKNRSTERERQRICARACVCVLPQHQHVANDRRRIRGIALFGWRAVFLIWRCSSSFCTSGVWNELGGVAAAIIVFLFRLVLAWRRGSYHHLGASRPPHAIRLRSQLLSEAGSYSKGSYSEAGPNTPEAARAYLGRRLLQRRRLCCSRCHNCCSCSPEKPHLMLRTQKPTHRHKSNSEIVSHSCWVLPSFSPSSSSSNSTTSPTQLLLLLYLLAENSNWTCGCPAPARLLLIIITMEFHSKSFSTGGSSLVPRPVIIITSRGHAKIRVLLNNNNNNNNSNFFS